MSNKLLFIFNKYFSYHTSLIVFALLCTCCTKELKPAPVENLLFKQDSIRLVLAIDSIFDIQFDYPDSAFIGWQPYAEEALEKKIYRPLMSYYRYAVFNRAIFVEDIETASKLAERSLEIAELTNDSTYIGQANYNKAILFSAKDVLDSASYYFLQTVDYLQNGNDWGTELDAWNNLAEMTKMQGDLLTAEKYKLNVLHRTKVRKDKRELGDMYSNLSELYIEMDLLDKSQTYLDSAQYAYTTWGDPDNLHLLNANVSLAMANSKYDKALDLLHKLYLKSKDGSGAVNPNKVLFQLSNVHYQLDNQDSSKYYLKLFDEQKATNQLSRELQLEYYEMKYDYFTYNDSSKDTLTVLSEINSLLIEKLEQNKNLFGTKRLHQIEQAEKDNIILQKTIQNQDKNLTITWLIAGLATLLGSILFAFFYFMKRREIQKQKLIIRDQQRDFDLRSALMQNQLKERNRISQELHDDLGATLTSISMSTELLKKKHPEIKSREVEIISDSSSNLVDKMNEIVWSLNSNNDSLLSLVAYIRKFASEFLTDAGLPFSIDLPTTIPNIEIEGGMRRSIFLTSKEALNNIVKHAEASHVFLKFSIEKELFTILIEDDGKGFAINDETFIYGNGLRNMKNNMENINGNMEHLSKQKGSRIKLTFPLKPSES